LYDIIRKVKCIANRKKEKKEKKGKKRKKGLKEKNVSWVVAFSKNESTTIVNK